MTPSRIVREILWRAYQDDAPAAMPRLAAACAAPAEWVYDPELIS